MEKKLVIITGASSGIGAQTADIFAKQGYPLLLLARNTESIPAYANSLAKSVDVTNPQSLKDAIAEAESKFGAAEILINSAGAALPESMEGDNTDNWQTMFNTNVMGVLNSIQCVLSSMKARNSGTIINVSSTSGRRIPEGLGVYSASKFAVHTLSEAIRREASEHSVRVTTVAPGVVDTRMTAQSNYQKIKDMIKDGVCLSPQEVGEVIYYICTLPQHICIREVVLANTKQFL